MKNHREYLVSELAKERIRLDYLRELLRAEPSSDVADEASRMEAAAYAGTLVERSAKRANALQELLNGGANLERFCEECGELIPLERILAAPDCVCCRDCQTRRDEE